MITNKLVFCEMTEYCHTGINFNGNSVIVDAVLLCQRKVSHKDRYITCW